MIGVCIKYFHENYGGMLQAYATVSLLEKRGLQYELIRYKKTYSLVGVIKSLPRFFNSTLLNDKYEMFLKIRGKKRHLDFAKNDAIRMKAFQCFKDDYFKNLSPIYTGYEELCEAANKYSIVITGSDQLWSPAGLPTNFYNLMFVPEHIRKVSYASSFGVKEIPWYQKRRTANFLKRIDYISMRENRGSEIVKELIGKHVPVILDPVFMFDRFEWEKLIPKHEIIHEKYLFAYFLGKSGEYRKVTTQIAKKLGYKIVTLRHLDQYIPEDESFGDTALYDVGPDKFLNLLRGAEFVCTDSFHGTCFSIIHEKNFIVFDRYSEKSKNSKNSRIESLCDNLDLFQRRYINCKDIDKLMHSVIDYSAVNLRLEYLKKKAMNYLDIALEKV